MLKLSLQKKLNGALNDIYLDVEMHIEKGSLVALYGPSGSGKTSILRMLAGLLQPDSGVVTCDGESWFDASKKRDLKTQQRSLSIVFQDYALFPNLSVKENLLYACPKGSEDWVNELLEIIRLSDLQNANPMQLSGGQKQRLALARSIARRPKILLLDEPLSALDKNTRAAMQDEILNLHKRFSMTTILVSHDVGEVFKLSDYVYQLDGGRIQKHGTPNQVFLGQGRSTNLNLQAQILAIRKEDIVVVVSVLIGQDIIEMLVEANEAAAMKIGEIINITPKTFSPHIIRI